MEAKWLTPSADTMDFILDRDETAFARIMKAELDGATPEEIVEQLGGRWTVSMVRAYIKGISVIVNGDTSQVTVNEAGHQAQDPPPVVDEPAAQRGPSSAPGAGRAGPRCRVGPDPRHRRE